MRRSAVRSSVIRSVGYDGKDKVLEIEFRSGTVYRYLDVPAGIFVRLMASPSKGRYFDFFIRDCFATVRLPPAAPGDR